MKHQADFDPMTLQATKAARCDGDYYGLPWPCWGTPEIKHPGPAVPLRHAKSR